MIYDVLKNSHLYFPPRSQLAKAAAFVRNFDPAQSDGRYEIDGAKMYASVATYQTKLAEELRFETHRKYIDLQALILGCERIDVALFFDNFILATPYDDAKDIAFYKPPAHFLSLHMAAGIFAVFYPDDAHRPSCHFDSPANVRKIVVKIAVS